jgi:osomolarity two-component system sensor histidine kinase SLN1
VLAASLKAAQIASSLQILNSTIQTATSRILIQDALRSYITDGNNTIENWSSAEPDLLYALDNGNNGLLQAVIWPRDGTGPAGYGALLNTTVSIGSSVYLPTSYPNGTAVALGDVEFGFPASLYPSLSEGASSSSGSAPYPFNTTSFINSKALLLGPLIINQSYALLSISVPIENNGSTRDYLGYLTVVADASMILGVLSSREGLYNTGEALIISPSAFDNRFPMNSLFAGPLETVSNNGQNGQIQNYPVHFAFTPIETNSTGQRHQLADGTGNWSFPMSQYPAVVTALTSIGYSLGSSGSVISTVNEQNFPVSVGFAIPNTNLCEWVLLVEEDKSEVYGPINTLRNIILACVFGTVGAMLIAIVPIAHYAVAPIRELREATKLTRRKPQVHNPDDDDDDDDDLEKKGKTGGIVSEKEKEKPTVQQTPATPTPPSTQIEAAEATAVAKKQKRSKLPKRFLALIRRKKSKKQEENARPRLDNGNNIVSESATSQQQTFMIPSKVKPRKQLVKDELTDLVQTYNDMIDELVTQYETLEDRVKDRTRELEVSKKVAELANESKTHFIASITHELKTPLNGILGSCAICMSETDIRRIKRSLAIVNESGELLLSLLDDLLTFSKHQVQRQIALDERTFRMAIIGSQLYSIFQKQAVDADIDLNVKFENSLSMLFAAAATFNGGKLDPNNKIDAASSVVRIEALRVWGDKNRILQVLINLVSNSLKFTPKGGSIQIRVRCTGETTPAAAASSPPLSRKASTQSSVSFAGANGNGPGQTTASSARATPDMSRPVIFRSDSQGKIPQRTKTFMFEFDVQDTGPGIAEELQQRVFEPFVQGDPGLSRRYGGTGLGLSICTSLARVMGGQILLKSTPGLGSTFTMQIPLKVVSEPSGLDHSSVGRQSGSFDNEDRHERKALSLQSGELHSIHSVDEEGSMNSGKARLVGLSQPFFTTVEPLGAGAGSPGSDDSPNGKHQPGTSSALARGAITSSNSDPIQPIPGSSTPSAADKKKNRSKIRVLVADDNPINQEIVLRMLKLENIDGMYFSVSVVVMF